MYRGNLVSEKFGKVSWGGGGWIAYWKWRKSLIKGRVGVWQKCISLSSLLRRCSTQLTLNLLCFSRCRKRACIWMQSLADLHLVQKHPIKNIGRLVNRSLVKLCYPTFFSLVQLSATYVIEKRKKNVIELSWETQV